MQIRGLLLDVEGVLVADKRYRAVAAAPAFIRTVRAARCPLRLITNNTTEDKPAILAKLSAAGFDFSIDELHTCTAAAVRYLQDIDARRCLVLGSPALQAIFREAGLEVVNTADVDAVVVGLDTDFDYTRLQTACAAILEHAAPLVALHLNRLYTDHTGRRAPSVGSLAAAITFATQREPVVIGKPSPTYYQQVLDDLDLAPADVLIISDDPLSDLAGAKRMGMSAAFVLSGKYADEDILRGLPENDRPDVVVPHIGRLLADDLIAFAGS